MKQKEFNEIVDKHAEKYGKKMTLHVVGEIYKEVVSGNPELEKLESIDERDLSIREIIGNKLKAELGE